MPEDRKWWQVLQGWANVTDPTRDVKLAGFGVVVLAGVYWLTKEQAHAGITPNWVNAFYGLCSLVGLGGAALIVADKIKGSGSAADQPAKPRTTDQEGK